MTDGRSISSDGTVVTWSRAGHGPSLVIVPGAGDDRRSWYGVRESLCTEWSVTTLDRRGRRGSGDAPVHSIDVEVDDVRSVIDDSGRRPHLLGHSYGGICALEAVARGAPVRSLVLYEPPIVHRITDETLDELTALVAAGDMSAFAAAALERVIGVPAREVRMLQTLERVWAQVLDNAPSLLRELHAVAAHRLDTIAVAMIDVPVLLLTGTESPAFYREGIDLLHGALPHAQVVELPGQHHLAHAAAPKILAEAVASFLRDVEAIYRR